MFFIDYYEKKPGHYWEYHILLFTSVKNYCMRVYYMILTRFQKTFQDMKLLTFGIIKNETLKKQKAFGLCYKETDPISNIDKKTSGWKKDKRIFLEKCLPIFELI